jgi:murein DD-endopeptidase MepM/ murein hydrolase activator NlpD
MARIKYHFNPHTLKYEKVIVGVRKRLLIALGWVATAIVFGALFLWIAYTHFDSPKERQMRNEIEAMKYQYDMLQKRVDLSENVLRDLENRDDHIYRVIFEADPIPRSIRQAGYGGIEKYKTLQQYDNGKLMTETSKKLERLEKQLYVQSKSFDETLELAKGKATMLASIPSIQPLSSNTSVIGSGFGYRIHPIYKTSLMHSGIDFTSNIGVPIYATGDGTVVEVAYEGRGYGNHVIINHGYGYESLYGHMSKISVRRGQKVKRGETIGAVGNTGSSTGPHCHYEVIRNGSKINPINFFYNDLSPEQYQIVIEQASKANQSFD